MKLRFFTNEKSYSAAFRSAIIGYYRQGATLKEIKQIANITTYEIGRIIDAYLKALSKCE